MGSFLKLKKLILDEENFLIICHEHPDGDSIGSMLALQQFLQIMGKNVTVVSKDPIPDVFRFLEGSGQIKNDFLAGDYGVVLLVDNGDLKRTGFAGRLAAIRRKHIPIINIDHHPKNDLWKLATINYADTTCSSACELIYKIITGLEGQITPTMATALLTGIYTDTGGFQHSNTSREVLEVASKLMKRGARLRTITANITNSHSIAMLKLWGIALSRLCFNHRFGLTYSVLTQKDICDAGACEDEVSGLVNLINSIPESRVALLLYETQDGKIKGSLRTESDMIDLSKIANLMGGGGHKRASGFSINGKLEQIGSSWQAK